jgi:hypothetical protein
MPLSKPRVSCIARLMSRTYSHIHTLDLDKPVGQYVNLVGANGAPSSPKFVLNLNLIFWLDYERVAMSLSSLAEEISDPTNGRRLNGLSIPSNHLVGEANDIWR